MNKLIFFVIIVLSSFITPLFGQTEWIIESPAQKRYCIIDTSGTSIIPNGRLIKPLGKTFRIAPHPFGLALSKDGNIAITSNSGTAPFSISILHNILSGSPTINQIPKGDKTDNDLLSAVFMGLAISPDNKHVFVAGGQENKIYVFEIASGKIIKTINCKSSIRKVYKDGYIGDMVLSNDGSRLYAIDQIGFRLIVVDTKSMAVVDNIPTGRYPFGIALSPDQNTVHIANVGMFEYSYIQDGKGRHSKKTATNFPVYKFGSEESKRGIKNDTLLVNALGDPNSPESFSIWSYDVRQNFNLVSKVKTGSLVGEKIEGIPAVGGASPNSIAATDKYVFVSNGNNDCISVIDAISHKVIKNIPLQPDKRLGRWKGVIPFGVALSPDHKRLYVAESGINAVGIIDIKTLQVLGHIPVGWFPSKLSVTPDGKKLIVANAKGYGSGPNGGNGRSASREANYIGKLMKGSVSIVEIPEVDSLKKYTTEVLHNNFLFKKIEETASQKKNIIPPAPSYTGSPIKYLVFVSKENRTYDDIFGQLKNGKGDSTLARYGKNASFKNKNGTLEVKDAVVMPNHLKLASEFSIGDNFYVDSDVSADGHRWLVNTYPNEWLETGTAAAYGGKRKLTDSSEAPGKFGMTGASGAIYPEDYNQDGSMWEHMERNKISFFNFGFGVEFDNGSFADSTMKYGGVRYLVNYPLPGPLYDKTSRLFPTFNMAIPDQFRTDIFIKEFNARWKGPLEKLPSMLTVQLLNDHGAGERPHAGFPFKESYMADNDLALGRLVEFLSHTEYWKNMAIFVTEDDAQDGNDHIDAHRSILMVISPYAKRNYVSKEHYSFGSIFKTFWNTLGIPYLNQYDAGATDLNDLFTNEPDFSPYVAVSEDIRIFDPQKALTPIDEKFDWKAMKDSPDLDDVKYIMDQNKQDDRIKKKK